MKIVDGTPTAGVEPFEFTTRYSRCVVTEIDYQRNGICGAGFFVLRFRCDEWPGRSLVATVFDRDENGGGTPVEPRTAVIDPNDLTDHFRGDVFDAGLRAAIAARYDQIWSFT